MTKSNEMKVALLGVLLLAGSPGCEPEYQVGETGPGSAMVETVEVPGPGSSVVPANRTSLEGASFRGEYDRDTWEGYEEGIVTRIYVLSVFFGPDGKAYRKTGSFPLLDFDFAAAIASDPKNVGAWSASPTEVTVTWPDSKEPWVADIKSGDQLFVGKGDFRFFDHPLIRQKPIAVIPAGTYTSSRITGSRNAGDYTYKHKNIVIGADGSITITGFSSIRLVDPLGNELVNGSSPQGEITGKYTLSGYRMTITPTQKQAQPITIEVWVSPLSDSLISFDQTMCVKKT